METRGNKRRSVPMRAGKEIKKETKKKKRRETLKEGKMLKIKRTGRRKLEKRRQSVIIQAYTITDAAFSCPAVLIQFEVSQTSLIFCPEEALGITPHSHTHPNCSHNFKHTGFGLIFNSFVSRR